MHCIRTTGRWWAINESVWTLIFKWKIKFPPSYIWEAESTLLKINKTFYWANKELKVNCFAYAFKTIESMYCQYLEALLCYQKTKVRSVENWIFNQATDSKFDPRDIQAFQALQTMLLFPSNQNYKVNDWILFFMMSFIFVFPGCLHD